MLVFGFLDVLVNHHRFFHMALTLALINVPVQLSFIVIQRYNRPRLVKLKVIVTQNVFTDCLVESFNKQQTLRKQPNNKTAPHWGPGHLLINNYPVIAFFISLNLFETVRINVLYSTWFSAKLTIWASISTLFPLLLIVVDFDCIILGVIWLATWMFKG